jgi:hypothetical protein
LTGSRHNLAEMGTPMGTPGEATLRRFAGASEASWKAETQRLRQRKDAPARNLLDLIGAKGIAPRVTRSSGIWIPRVYRGRVLVTMGGARPPLRSVRSA